MYKVIFTLLSLGVGLPLSGLAKELVTPVQWLEPASTQQTLSKEALQSSNIISDFVQMLHAESAPSASLKIVVGGEGSPSVDVDAAELHMSYSYFTDAIRAQGELQETQEAALAAGLDMLEYTLYHMLGHALVGDADPQADVAAEEIATWTMLTSWPNGGEQWLTAVAAFGSASQKLDGPLSDYWHAHSLYKSRQRQLECAVLGFDPQRYEKLLKAVLDPQQRRKDCSRYWRELEKRVLATLAEQRD